MSGALSGTRASGGDDAVVISVPPPSGAPTAPGGTPKRSLTGGGPRLRELRLPGRGARARSARVRDPRDLGHAGVTPSRRRAGAVVRVVPVAVPPRGRRGRRTRVVGSWRRAGRRLLTGLDEVLAGPAGRLENRADVLGREQLVGLRAHRPGAADRRAHRSHRERVG